MEGKNWTKYRVLFSLYIAQSIPMSFFSTVVPVIMRQENYSLGSIGLMQLVKLPWIIKFLWAPLIDNKARTMKQLRSWILLSEIFYALIILSIGLFDLQTDFRMIVFLMIIAFIASATQDIAVDIFAILHLKPEERSIGNSMQSAGSFVGSLFGTGILLIAYHYLGWTALLILLSCFVVFAVAPLLFYRKPPIHEKSEGISISMNEIGLFFTQKGEGRRILILVFYYSGIIGILTLLKPYLVDLGYDVRQIGLMSGIFGTSVAVVSSFAGGFVIKNIGRKASMYLFLFISLLAATWFWIISENTPGTTSIYLAIALLWGAYGLSTVAIYTTSMDRVRKDREGTDFTIQIVITHLSSLIIAILSGKLGDLMGYRNFFGIEIGLCLFTFLILLFSSKKEQNANI